MSDEKIERDCDLSKFDIFESVAANELYKSLRQTAQARFEANRRLLARDHKNNRLVAASSAVVIVVTVLPYIFMRADIWTDVFAFISITMALAILVASLLHYSRIDAATAEQQHRSALEISELRREMHASAPHMSQAKFLKISKRYDAILQKFSVNHDKCDMNAVIADRPDEYPWETRGKIRRLKIQNWIREVAPDLVTLLIVLSISIVSLIFYFSDSTHAASGKLNSVQIRVDQFS